LTTDKPKRHRSAPSSSATWSASSTRSTSSATSAAGEGAIGSIGSLSPTGSTPSGSSGRTRSQPTARASWREPQRPVRGSVPGPAEGHV